MPQAKRTRAGMWRLAQDAGGQQLVDLRARVARMLDDVDQGHLTFEAQLLVTELAANALTHAGPAEVRVTCRPAVVRAEVRDGWRDGLPDLGAVWAGPGMGLRIVHTAAPRWGVNVHAHGKTVWFELDGSG